MFHLELLLGGETPLLDVLHETMYRVLGTSHPLDFFTRAVSSTWVRHPGLELSDLTSSRKTLVNLRVSTITVGDEFEKKRSFLVLDSPLPGVLYSLLGCDNIHSIDLEDDG